MFSYIFMKILESRPERYDSGIAFLSGGHATKIRKQIVKKFITPGMNILDLGCGTGVLLCEAANAGASATGIDISADMLRIARKRVLTNGLQKTTTLINAGATELENLFPGQSFDVITSTLVFSELYADERLLVLGQIKRLLKPQGKLIIACEVLPKGRLKRMLHFLIRFPLSILTYLIAQTGTKPMKNLPGEVSISGFSDIETELSFLDSFMVLQANNNNSSAQPEQGISLAKLPDEDKSVIKTIWDFLGRWFPNPVEPGLRIIGTPDRKAPLLITSNFHLTVRRVEKALLGQNLFLLVVPTNGINVWCASAGGDLNTHSVITAIKTSRINKRVSHKRIILPQFSASGIDLKLLKKETGRKGLFGPAYARDIPLFLDDHKSVFKTNRTKFALPFRLEMLLAMNFIIWLGVALFTLIVDRSAFYTISLYFWIAGFVLYAGFPFMPGKSGWAKAGMISIGVILLFALYSVLLSHISILAYWKIILSFTIINFLLGFDLKGIVAGYPSEAEWLLLKLRAKSFGHIFSSARQMEGFIHQDISKCNDCRMCLMVCPKNVYTIELGNQVRIKNPDECFACRGCVTQCASDALFLAKEEWIQEPR